MEEEPVGRVRVEVSEGIEEEGSPVGGIFPGDVARGAVGKAEVHEGVGLADAVHLVEEADEVLEVFEEMGGVDFVDRSVPEGERTGDIGTDIDAGERREVDAERSRVLTESAPEVHDDPFSRLRHAHVPRREMTAPGWSKYGPRAATGQQAPWRAGGGAVPFGPGRRAVASSASAEGPWGRTCRRRASARRPRRRSSPNTFRGRR